MTSLIINNPVIQRYRFSVMRPRQFGIHLAVYLIIVLLILLINIGAGASAADIFAQMLIFQLVLLWGWAAHNTASAIKDEVADKTYDFFRMLPLSAHQKAIGILIGKNLVALLFTAVNSVLLVFLALLSITLDQLLQLMLILASGAFFINAVSLLSSIKVERRKRRSGNVALLLLLLFSVGPLLAMFGELADSNWGADTDIQFYHAQIPALIFIASVALYLGCWAYTGVIRRLTKENQCLFTRPGAVFLFISCQLILLGLFLPHFPGSEPRALNYAFWALSLAPALFISLGAIRTFADYWDKSKTLTSLPHPRFIRGMFFYSNIKLAILLFVLWLPFALFSAVQTGVGFGEPKLVILVLLLFYMFMVSLMELWALYRPDSEKIGVLLVVVCLVYFVVPLICASVFDFGYLAIGSPLGLLYRLCQEGPLSTGELVCLLFYHALLWFVPAVRICQKWDKIRELRTSVES